MEIIVVGCGRVGAELAYRLYQKHHKVTVIDSNVEDFKNLHSGFRGRTIEGEILNQGVLARAGVEQVDGLAAVTNFDPLNAVVGHIARTIYHIPNVIVRNYDPRWLRLHQAFGHQVVGSSSWGAQRIEELLYHQDVRTVFSAGNGEVEVYEFTVPPRWDGRVLEDLLPGRNCSLAALTRAGQAMLPDDSTVLETGDIVLVSATFKGIEELLLRLNSLKEA